MKDQKKEVVLKFDMMYDHLKKEEYLREEPAMSLKIEQRDPSKKKVDKIKDSLQELDWTEERDQKKDLGMKEVVNKHINMIDLKKELFKIKYPMKGH